MRATSRVSFAAATYPLPQQLVPGGSSQKFTLTDVFIDATNGNDQTGDASALKPWKTNARIRAAVGLYGTLDPANLGKLLTIHYVGPTAPPASDPFSLQAIFAPDVVLLRDFTAIPRPVLHTGSFTGVAPVSHAGNTPATFVDAAIGNWAPFVGKRLRVTSGVATGATCMVLFNDPFTPLVAEVGPPATVSGVGGGAFATVVYPAPGDSYVIEDLPIDARGASDFLCSGGLSTNSTMQTLGAQVTQDFPPGSLTRADLFIYEIQCLIVGGATSSYIATNEALGFAYVNCGFKRLGLGFLPTLVVRDTEVFIDACGIIGNVLAFGGGSTLIEVGANDTTVMQGGWLSVAGAHITIQGSAGVMRATVGFLNPFGDGFTGAGFGINPPGFIDQTTPGVFGAVGVRSTQASVGASDVGQPTHRRCNLPSPEQAVTSTSATKQWCSTTTSPLAPTMLPSLRHGRTWLLSVSSTAKRTCRLRTPISSRCSHESSDLSRFRCSPRSNCGSLQ